MNVIRDMLARQFDAAAQMLHDSIETCPDHVWTEGLGGAAFWHLAYHAMFFLDLYLHRRETDFAAAPFHRDESHHLRTAVPDRPYTKSMLLGYLQQVRDRARLVLAGLTEEDLTAPSPVSWYTIRRGEFLLNNLRHTQHHIGQLNLILKAHGQRPPDWQGTSG